MIANRISEHETITVESNLTVGKKPMPLALRYKEGFYIFSVQALLRGSVENFLVTETVSGLCSQIEYNPYTERIAYMTDYNSVVVIPIPHLNTVNGIGMENKHEYLIWR